MLHLVGWEQGFTAETLLADDLTQTESGLTFQQAHPMVTLDNIRSIMPERYDEQYQPWDEHATYRLGEKVKSGGLVWISGVDWNQGHVPPASDYNDDYAGDFGSDYWRLYNPLSDFILWMTRGAIAKTVQTFLQVKSVLKESKNLLERHSLFDGAGRMSNTILNGQRIVGMEIVPAYSAGVTLRLERIGLQMTGAKGKVTLYIFHSSKRDPFKTIDFDVVKGDGSMEWKDLKDCYLPYQGDTGAWYVVYNQADLPEGMEAVNVTKDWSREPCGTCNRGSLEAWRQLTKFVMVSPMKVQALETFAEYPELWDIKENIYTNTHNYGMNMMLSVGCDLSDFIISQKEIFATVLQRQLACDFLRQLAMNPDVRVNRRQSNATTADLLYEVDGNPQGRKTGLGEALKEAYEALDIDTRGIDRICLTCRPVGVRYTTA